MAVLNFGASVRVSGKKLVYDLERKDWMSKSTTIIIPQPARHFDAGGMRVCFFVQEQEEDGCSTDCVAKFFKTDIPDVVYADYLNEAMAQCLSEEFAQNFNKLDTPKKISFLTCDVVVVDKREIPEDVRFPPNHFFSFRTQDTNEVTFCMEPKLRGEFTKYNSNFGDTYANNKRDQKHLPTALDSVFISAEAFSHFTLQESGGSMLVCDLQGVEDLLTDPQIHTEEGKGLGMGNMGEEGIDKWAESHHCNEVCNRLGLTPAVEIIRQNKAPPAPPVASTLPPSGSGSPTGAPGSPPPVASAGFGSLQSNTSVVKPSGQVSAEQHPPIPRPPGTWDSVSTASLADSRYQQLTHSMMESIRRGGHRMSDRPILPPQMRTDTAYQQPPTPVFAPPQQQEGWPGQQPPNLHPPPPQNRPPPMMNQQQQQQRPQGLGYPQQSVPPRADAGRYLAPGSMLPSPFEAYGTSGGKPAYVGTGYTQQPPPPSMPPSYSSPSYQPPNAGAQQPNYNAQPQHHPGPLGAGPPQQQPGYGGRPPGPGQPPVAALPMGGGLGPGPGGPAGQGPPPAAALPPMTEAEAERERLKNMSEDELIAMAIERSKRER